MGKDFLGTITGNQTQTIPGTTVTSEDLPAGGDEKTGMFSSLTNKEILAGGLAGTSAFLQIGAGKSAAQGYELQAQQSSVAAENARQMGVDQELAIRNRYTKNLSTAQTAMRASGIKGGATMGATINALQRGEEIAASGARNTAEMNAAAHEATGHALRRKGLSKQKEGLYGAFGEAASFATRFVERGKVKD
jgi:hypothetical protein